MAKRRTKKQKEAAKHQFSVSWKPDQENSFNRVNVNRQKSGKTSKATSKQKNSNLSKNMEKNSNIASIKKDLMKSLGIAALILASELVLYLIL